MELPKATQLIRPGEQAAKLFKARLELELATKLKAQEEVFATFALITLLSSLAWLFYACLKVLLVQPESWQGDLHLGLCFAQAVKAMVAHLKQAVVAMAEG